MHNDSTSKNARRHFLATAGALSTGLLLPDRFALAQTAAKIRVGLMLP
jgi:hypothetical protein